MKNIKSNEMDKKGDRRKSKRRLRYALVHGSRPHFTLEMHFRVSVAPWLPWASPPSGNTTNIRGVAEEVYGSLYRIGIPRYDLRVEATFGIPVDDYTWSGMLGSLSQNVSDIGGPFFISEERTRAVDFTTPLAFCKLAIMTGLTSKRGNPFLMFNIFSLKVLLLFVVFAFLCSGANLLIYLVLGSIHSAQMKPMPIVFSKYVWLYHFSLIGHEFGSNCRWFLRHIWWHTSFRSLQSAWFITSLVFVYTYQGAIISTFASDRLTPIISNLDDLEKDSNMRVATFTNSYAFHVVKKLKGTEYDSIYQRVLKDLFIPMKTGTVPEWLSLVEDGKMVFINANLLSNTMLGDMFLQTRKCGIRTIPIEAGASYNAFGFNKLFPKKVVQEFNNLLLRFNQGALSHRKVTESSFYYDLCSQVVEQNIEPLSFSDVMGAFFILGIGLFLSCALIISELCIHRQVE